MRKCRESGEQKHKRPENRWWREDGNRKKVKLKQKKLDGDWMESTKEAKEIKDRAERGAVLLGNEKGSTRQIRDF